MDDVEIFQICRVHLFDLAVTKSEPIETFNSENIRNYQKKPFRTCDKHLLYVCSKEQARGAAEDKPWKAATRPRCQAPQLDAVPAT